MAPFGRGERTLWDASVRSTWQVDASRISFCNPGEPSALPVSDVSAGTDSGPSTAANTAFPAAEDPSTNTDTSMATAGESPQECCPSELPMKNSAAAAAAKETKAGMATEPLRAASTGLPPEKEPNVSTNMPMATANTCPQEEPHPDVPESGSAAAAAAAVSGMLAEETQADMVTVPTTAPSAAAGPMESTDFDHVPGTTEHLLAQHGLAGGVMESPDFLRAAAADPQVPVSSSASPAAISHSESYTDSCELVEIVFQKWGNALLGASDGYCNPPRGVEQCGLKFVGLVCKLGLHDLLLKALEKLKMMPLNIHRSQILLLVVKQLSWKAVGDAVPLMCKAEDQRRHYLLHNSLAQDVAELEGLVILAGCAEPVLSQSLAACLEMLHKKVLAQGKDGNLSSTALPHHLAVTLITAFSKLYCHLAHDRRVPAQQHKELQGAFVALVKMIFMNPKAFPACEVLAPACLSLASTGSNVNMAGSPALLMLLAGCQHNLGQMAAVSASTVSDWRVPAKLSCTCQSCRSVQFFLDNPSQQTKNLTLYHDALSHVRQSLREVSSDVTLSEPPRKRTKTPYTITATKKHDRNRIRMALRRKSLPLLQSISAHLNQIKEKAVGSTSYFLEQLTNPALAGRSSKEAKAAYAAVPKRPAASQQSAEVIDLTDGDSDSLAKKRRLALNI
ncbi:hypothetical protein WJX74_005991 [Apatococcus lobatus]|uniref:Uncharacterized protein n=1 Tax=Apatococcus lobatus TaxID=904363 RepID=A0AAW1QZ65_9CHLO